MIEIIAGYREVFGVFKSLTLTLYICCFFLLGFVYFCNLCFAKLIYRKLSNLSSKLRLLSSDKKRKKEKRL